MSPLLCNYHGSFLKEIGKTNHHVLINPAFSLSLYQD
jgi:hypothetical protein